MQRKISVVGAPSSAGAYAPGQEKAPDALRAMGLIEKLRAHDLDLTDLGNVPGFRWQPDLQSPRAMNVDVAGRVAESVADQVSAAVDNGRLALVLGGDCTVELGTVSGVLRQTRSVGLIYIDLDADLNTPGSTCDGALDWMGVAHLLALPETEPALTDIGPRTPLLDTQDVLLFGIDNVTDFEQAMIDQHQISSIPFDEVIENPACASKSALESWANRYESFLVHLDVDILDFAHFPIAENVRRNRGLRFHQLETVLHILLKAPNLTAVTIAEINPDHCDSGHSTITRLAQSIASALSVSTRTSSL